MKTTGTTRWNTPNTGATNESGFAGLPGGNRDANGPFYDVGDYGLWWSSTEDGTGAWYHYLVHLTGNILRNSDNKKNGFSVRCLRD